MVRKTLLLNILPAVLVTALLLCACGQKQPEGTQQLPVIGPGGQETTALETEVPSGETSTEAVTESEPETTAAAPTETESETPTETEAPTETETETETPAETEPETEEAQSGFVLVRDDLPDNIWVFRRGRTYYLGSGKQPVTGLAEIGGKSYLFDEDGVMTEKEFVTINGKLYYFGEDGAMLKDTKISGYVIDSDGVCKSDYASGRFTLTPENLNDYCDYLLQKNGRSLEAIYEFVWKGFRQRPNDPIGSLLNPTQAQIDQMIIRFFNDGGGACCDYSYATQRLLQRAGYKNVIVHSYTNLSRHQWNLVQVRPGVWRHMDTFRKAYRIFTKTDDEIAALDSPDVRYYWDRTKWTSETPTGTGGKNPEPETTAAPETTEAPKPTVPPTTQAPPETTKAAEPVTTEAPEPETTEAPEPTTEPGTTETEPTETTATEAPETTAEPETTAPETTAPETTEAPAQPTETDPPVTETEPPVTTQAGQDPEQPAPGDAGTP